MLIILIILIPPIMCSPLSDRFSLLTFLITRAAKLYTTILIRLIIHDPPLLSPLFLLRLQLGQNLLRLVEDTRGGRAARIAFGALDESVNRTPDHQE